MSGYEVDVDLTLHLKVQLRRANTVEDAIEEAAFRVVHATQNIGKRDVGFQVTGTHVHATDAVEIPA